MKVCSAPFHLHSTAHNLRAPLSPQGATSGASKATLDNHANQFNPNNPRYQGGSTQYQGTGTKADLNNHANQLNPNNPRYAGSQKK